jgi:hypothetical protein
MIPKMLLHLNNNWIWNSYENKIVHSLIQYQINFHWQCKVQKSKTSQCDVATLAQWFSFYCCFVLLKCVSKKLIVSLNSLLSGTSDKQLKTQMSSCKLLQQYEYLSVYGSIVLLLNLGRFFSFIILHTFGTIPWAGDQSVARPLPTHRITETE